MENLKEAGFTGRSIGVSIMAALPGQSREEVEKTVDAVLEAGLVPHLSEFSPIPQNPMFQQAAEASAFDLTEPLYHNPTLLPCAGDDLDNKALSEIKRRLRDAIGRA